MTTLPPHGRETRAAIARLRKALLHEEARAAGLLGSPKDARVAGRVSARLLAEAKKRAGVASDTELIELALSRLALEDDFGPKLLRRKGRVPPRVAIEL